MAYFEAIPTPSIVLKQKIYILADLMEEKVTVYYDKQKVFNRLKREYVSTEGIEAFREDGYKVNDSDIKILAENINMFVSIKTIKFVNE